MLYEYAGYGEGGPFWVRVADFLGEGGFKPNIGEGWFLHVTRCS
jgi:hypothetical protein